MDNPYCYTENQRYHLSIETIRRLCFELLCMFKASRPIIESAPEDEDSQPDSLINLYEQLVFPTISEKLLQLAIMFRTFDDQMNDSEKRDEYRKCMEGMNYGRDYVGILNDGESFSLREACNKILHARTVRPLFERVDQCYQKENQNLWHLTGEIELVGTHQRSAWSANIHLSPFLEVILAAIDNNAPANGAL
ncbi:hypothetical protein MASR1M12_10210 [Erysipelotrichia bacterium]